MTVKINDKEYEVPFDPMIITLDQYIGYQDAYGKELDAELQEILEDSEINEEERLEKLDSHQDKEAIAWFSYWTKLDLFEAKDTPDIQPILEQYRILRSLFEDARTDSESKLGHDLKWRGEIWAVQDWKVNPATKMSFNEIVTSKEIMRQVKKFSLGKWVAMKYLCCVFLRKKDERFVDQLVWEGGERIELMGQLPLQYAMRVAFFFENLCRYLEENFSVFGANGNSDMKAALSAHYEEWGWFSFLRALAETKVFDIPGSGMNSVDCVKETNSYVVLMYASEQKDYNSAFNEDYKIK